MALCVLSEVCFVKRKDQLSTENFRTKCFLCVQFVRKTFCAV